MFDLPTRRAFVQSTRMHVVFEPISPTRYRVTRTPAGAEGQPAEGEEVVADLTKLEDIYFDLKLKKRTPTRTLHRVLRPVWTALEVPITQESSEELDIIQG